MAPAGTEPSDASEPGLLSLLIVFLRHRRLVIGLPGVLAILVVGISLLLPRSYTASASFMPQNDAGGLSRLAGLAAQFGLNLPAPDQGQSSDFYADLLRSDQLLRALVETRYAFSSGGDSVRGNLVELYDIHEATYERSREAAVRQLRSLLEVSTTTRTGVVTLSATARYPELAKLIAEHALAQVNEFNLESRKSQASAERVFVESRLRETEGELREAEDRMQRFLQQNRDYSNSPQLTFQHDRLQRDLDTRQQVYTSLAQNYEQARINEVRDTPVITVVEMPILPARPDSRRIVLKALVAILLGGLLGIFIAVGREVLRRQASERPGEITELQNLGALAWREARHPWQTARRALVPGDQGNWDATLPGLGRRDDSGSDH